MAGRLRAAPEARQLAGSAAVEWGAVPVRFQAQEVERGGHERVAEARSGQGPQAAEGKAATAAAWPRCVHDVHDDDVFPCGQVTVLVS